MIVYLSQKYVGKLKIYTILHFALISNDNKYFTIIGNNNRRRSFPPAVRTSTIVIAVSVPSKSLIVS